MMGLLIFMAKFTLIVFGIVSIIAGFIIASAIVCGVIITVIGLILQIFIWIFGLFYWIKDSISDLIVEWGNRMG